VWSYLIGEIAARVAVVLCVFTIALPYLLRRGRVSRGFGLAQDHAVPYLRRMWPHVWMGYAILALSTAHAGTVMGAMAHANRFGLLAATAAFFVLLFGVVVGLSLRDETLPQRRPVRRLHFWTMIAFVALLAAHLYWNR
jgi:hypothetical protein